MEDVTTRSRRDVLFDEMLNDIDEDWHAEQLNHGKYRHKLRPPFFQVGDVGVMLFDIRTHAVIAINADKNDSQVFYLVF